MFRNINIYKTHNATIGKVVLKEINFYLKKIFENYFYFSSISISIFSYIFGNYICLWKAKFSLSAKIIIFSKKASDFELD